MTDRPILFSGPMVRATLEGRKTQTRRVVKGVRRDNCIATKSPTTMRTGTVSHVMDSTDLCPYGQPGDFLWVRETWAHVPITAYRRSVGVQQTPDPTDSDMAAVYAAGWDRSPPSRWRPSIHMPRWASRLTLRVTDVRVERLQDISEEDAKDEGVEWDEEHGAGWREYGEDAWPGVAACGNARESFHSLWDSLNEKRGHGWDTNPWVWVVRFEPIRKNVDEVPHD